MRNKVKGLNKKLRLNKNTVADLTADNMKAINGGFEESIDSCVFATIQQILCQESAKCNPDEHQWSLLYIDTFCS